MRKKIKNLIIALPIMLFAFSTLYGQSIYVSPAGNDSSSGTKESPVQTFAKAQALARALPASDSVEVVFENGTYYLPQTIAFSDTDNKASVTYRAAEEGKAIISGGSLLTLTWQLYKNGIYVADVPGNLVIDQLYINGKRQRMARFPNTISGKNVYDTWDLSTSPSYSASLDPLTSTRIASWSNPAGGYIHAMHPLLWGDMHWLIKGKDGSGNLIKEGGWQNNRPDNMHGVYRIVENIFEELDVPGEWFYNSTTQKIYYMPEIGTNLSTATVEIVRLKNLIEFNGSKAKPVKTVNLKGFVFRHAARTFMENKEPLLRSDWTISRTGAIVYNGAEDCILSDCDFDQVGGNTILVNNYNRRITVKGCYIHNSGASGVVFVGDPAMVRSPLYGYVNQNYSTMDRTPGPKGDNYPDNCLVEDCIITMTGRDEKQTAPIEISMSHKIRVNHCSIYDVPRAGVNIGEGTFGGHVLENCDIFNTVLETGDHGSFNSWGRDRFWTPDINTTVPQVAKAPKMPFWDMLDSIVIRNNRIRCDHGWDIDLDDGSTWYRIYNNLLLNGGLKMREGYNRKATNNVIINNSLHPHVWYQNSGDEFKNNIVFTAYQPAAMDRSIATDGKWGKELNRNFFAANATAMKSFIKNGCDSNSINGYPLFLDSIKGNFQIKPNSPALYMGFKNFPMDQFGVVKASLKAIAKKSIIPTLNIKIDPVAGAIRSYYWMGILLKEPTAAELSAYGVGFDEGGVALGTVADSSSAATDGFKSADLIQNINGTTIKTIADFNTYIEHHINDTTAQVFTVVRNQVKTTVTIRHTLAKITDKLTLTTFFSIPGKFEAEGYFQNNGIQSESTSDVGGGKSVGYIDAGDWADYAVNVKDTASYDLNIRYAGQNKGSIKLQIIGAFETKDLTTISTPVTGGWQTWQTLKTTVKLDAGKQVLRMLFVTPGYNLNWFNLSKTASTFVKTLNEDIISIYPNPTHGIVQISNTEKISKIEIFSATGVKVKTIHPVTTLIDISNFNKGLYVFKLYSNSQMVSLVKLLKI